MKFFLIILIFIPVTAISQLVVGKVVNENREAIPFTNIALMNKKVGACTEIDGSFKLEIKGEIKDSIKISSIGYHSQTIQLSELGDSFDLGEIVLLKKNLEIDEVRIVSNKIKFSKKHRIGLDKIDNISFYTLYGDEICTFIENEKNQRGKLSSINLYLNKRRGADYTADINIKLYEFNSYKKTPGEIFYSKNIVISPGNKKQVFSISVKNENIIIPKEGICIGVEWLGKEKGSRKYTLGPGLKYTNASVKLLTYKNYRDRGWTNGSFKYDGKVSNALITLDVLYEK
jgi:hypothetical protein